MIDDVSVLAYLALVLVVTLTSVWTGFSVRNARQRTRDLQEVAEAMKVHYSALEDVLDSDGVSPALKSALSSVNSVTCSRTGANAFVQHVVKGSVPHSNQGENGLILELNGLRATNSDLGDKISTILRTGMYIIIYRWPENAKLARKAFRQLSTDEVLERNVENELIREVEHDDHLDDGPTADGGLALAH